MSSYRFFEGVGILELRFLGFFAIISIGANFWGFLTEGDDFAKILADNYFIDTLLELSEVNVDQIVED